MLFADVPVALTFDDVLLVPRHSDVLPREVDTEHPAVRAGCT
jgi:IMP dehydrogenase/GMP reductase